MKKLMVRLCSTDGDLLVPAENIDYALHDPSCESRLVKSHTIMVHLKGCGRCFEVSGSLDDLASKMAGDYYS